jgi:hypothetical protein
MAQQKHFPQAHMMMGYRRITNSIKEQEDQYKLAPLRLFLRSHHGMDP